MLGLDTVIARVDTVVSAEVGAALVMLNLPSSAYYDTDAIGAEIWRRLERPVAIRQICDSLVTQYDVDPQTCETDVLAFLTAARREGLIRIVEPPELR